MTTNTARPFHRSYWAIPGKLAAGCYPGARDPAEMREKLDSLVRAGVTLSVNLMEEEELDHSGKPFAGYESQLATLAGNAGQNWRMTRFAIPDKHVPSPKLMRQILTAIDAEIRAGGVVYVHCWGGKGRTATVIGCYLLAQGMESKDSVLDRLRSLTEHARESFWPTPQTDEQCDFVVNWIHYHA